ncbi:S-adenosyl-L-methionine-dependent methyltransferase [Cladochytrium replicatum]|nr:S-adenosyl-L-methionine-dependent methyltransferase [Cladochytrium replicatum]
MGSFCSKPTESSSRVATAVGVDETVARNWVSGGTGAGVDADGRTFHNENSPYVLPNDIMEGSRLNLQHHLLRNLFGGPNFRGVTGEALSKGLKVLDVGCGTGIWLAEMQRDYPNGTYYGVDISPTAWAETFQNLAGEQKIQLCQGNVMERLPFDDNTFDYVHQQLLVFGVPEVKWPHVISEVCRVLKPGGVADFVEMPAIMDHYEKPSELEMKMTKFTEDMFKARGVNVKISQQLASLVKKQAAFENVNETVKEAHPGWDGEIGKLWMVDGRKLFGGMKSFMAPAIGVPLDEWEATVDQYLTDAGNNRAFVHVVRVTATKARFA